MVFAAYFLAWLTPFLTLLLLRSFPLTERGSLIHKVSFVFRAKKCYFPRFTRKAFVKRNRITDRIRQEPLFKSDGQEISTIEWQELKNEFRLFSDYKKLLRIEEI